MLPLELHFLYTSTIIYQLQLKIVIESYIALIVTARIVAITHQFLSWKVGMTSMPKPVGSLAPTLESTGETRVDWVWVRVWDHSNPHPKPKITPA
jgi:hypothetical protein